MAIVCMINRRIEIPALLMEDQHRQNTLHLFNHRFSGLTICQIKRPGMGNFASGTDLIHHPLHRFGIDIYRRDSSALSANNLAVAAPIPPAPVTTATSPSIDRLRFDSAIALLKNG